MKGFTILFTFIAWPFFSFGQGAQKMHVLKKFPVSGIDGWDYLAVSPVHDWLYVSHGTQVNIVNKNTGDSVGIIEKTTGVHGIAFDEKNAKGFTSNGRLNTVTVFDINTNKVITNIAVGANPDAIMYEPFTKMIITCNGRSRSLSIIDPINNKLIDSIPLSGKPETAVSDNAGKLYVNIEDKNEIAVVALAGHKVINTWPLTPAVGPSGLAIDLKTRRLFSACDKLLIVMDAENGKIVTQLPIGDGCDGVAFDPGLKNIYTSNGEGNITLIREKSKNKFVILETIATQKTARTIALDEASHKLYLPAADIELPLPGEKGRPKLKPGSFKILVVGM